MKPKIKPRNPLVADAKFRKAGVHEKSEKARRRQEKLALAKEVKLTEKQRPEGWQKRVPTERLFASASANSFCARKTNMNTESRHAH